jgi:membrane associated rhomboid family serine protease
LCGIGNKINLNAGTNLSFINDIKASFNKATSAEKLIYINVSIFLLGTLFPAVAIDWLSLPTQINEFLQKPWTLISYSFVHMRFVHFLSVIIVLYFVGNLFLDFYDKKQFLKVYFLGVIVGAVVFLLNYYLTGKTGDPLGGASAAVSAIFVAIATKIPRYAFNLRFIGSVELWVLAAIWVVLNILQIVNVDNGPSIAHLGGAVFGFIYSKQLSAGNDIGEWFDKLLDFFANLFKSNQKKTLKTVYKSKRVTSKNEITKNKQRRINDILDKISKSGYESLSQEEKDFLFRAGKK